MKTKMKLMFLGMLLLIMIFLGGKSPVQAAHTENKLDYSEANWTVADVRSPEKTRQLDADNGKLKVILYAELNGNSNDKQAVTAMNEMIQYIDTQEVELYIIDYDEEDRTVLKEKVEEFKISEDICVVSGYEYQETLALFVEGVKTWDKFSVYPIVIYLEGDGTADTYNHAWLTAGDLLGDIEEEFGVKTSFDVNLTGTVKYSEAFSFVDMLNEARAEQGLQPMVMDSKLMEDAIVRTSEVAVNSSHTRPDGSNSSLAYPDMKLMSFHSGYATAEEYTKKWKYSSGYNANLMTDTYTRIGVSCVDFYGTCYWVLLLSKNEDTAASLPENMERTFTVNARQWASNMGVTCEYPIWEVGATAEFDVKGTSKNTSRVDRDSFIWSSSSPAVTIDENGVATMNSAGKVTITAVSKNNPDIVLTKEVTIVDEYAPVTITAHTDKEYYNVGDTMYITYEMSGGCGAYESEYFHMVSGGYSATKYGYNSQGSYGLSRVGVFKVHVTAKDVLGTSGKSEYIYIYVADGTLSAVAELPSSSVEVYAKCEIGAVAEGGVGNYSYSYLVYNRTSDTWERLSSEFSTSNTWEWYPREVGNYRVYVEVKDAAGNIVRSDATDITVTYPEMAVIVEADKESLVVGEQVTLDVTAWHGSGDYTYSYLVYNVGTKTWYRFNQTFTKKDTFTWTASGAGKREFYVEVKDSVGTVKRSKAVTVNVTYPALQITGKSTASGISVGEKVILTGTATGGDGNYTYSYLVYNVENGTWYRFHPTFTKNKTFTWTANSSGKRRFYVEVKDGQGTVTRSAAIVVNVK